MGPNQGGDRAWRGASPGKDQERAWRGASPGEDGMKLLHLEIYASVGGVRPSSYYPFIITYVFHHWIPCMDSQLQLYSQHTGRSLLRRPEVQ